MNTNLKNLLLMSTGFGLGFFLAKRLLSNKYLDMANQEIQEVRDHYRRTFSPSEDISEPVEELLLEEPLGVENTDVVDYNAKAKKYANTATKKDINTVMREKGLTPIEEIEEEEEYERMPIVNREINSDIFVIEDHSFFYENEHHDKLTLTYYEADNTLADEKDSIVPSPEDILGIGTLSSFESNVLYVRNNKISTDFEVIRSLEGYYETVLGAPLKPKAKKTKPKKSSEE